jgi:hypothetical protein
MCELIIIYLNIYLLYGNFGEQDLVEAFRKQK